MITSGSTQGLSIAANILYTDGAMALMEDPTHPGLRHVISNQGYGIQGIPADEKGLNTALLTSVHSLSFIYVTPSHQYPLGGVLPIQRRLALIQYASDQNCYLIEDDYDSEFRYEGQPIHSLYELNPNKVIYMGSFSKLLAPALRLGYLILPDHLIEFYKNRKKYTDLHTEVLTQYTLSAFMNNGGLEKHIGKMKKLYSRKRAHVIYQLDRYFHGQFEIRGQAAGLHLIVHFKHLTITNELLNILYENNVQLYGVSSYEFQHFGFHNHDILVGYAHLSFEEITLGIQILNQILTLTK